MNYETEAAFEALHALLLRCAGRIATLEVAMTGRETGGAFPESTDATKDAAVNFCRQLEAQSANAISALRAQIDHERGIQS